MYSYFFRYFFQYTDVSLHSKYLLKVQLLLIFTRLGGQNEKQKHN